MRQPYKGAGGEPAGLEMGGVAERLAAAGVRLHALLNREDLAQA